MKVKIKTGDKVTNECCDCNLQHIWIFKVVRGKSPQDDIIEMDIFPEHMPEKVKELYK